MIIGRAPLRVSFVGGGSDLPVFYREHGGAVISTAINKYVFVTINRKFDNGVRVAYSRTEEVSSASEVQHPLVRAALNVVGIEGGVEITTVADIPSRGSGLGSSSTFTVALLHGLYAYRGRYVRSRTLAEQACHVEINMCGEPIGQQDQYAAAFGGFHVYEFRPDDTVIVSPVICQPTTLQRLNERLLLLYTGVTRSASALLKEQSAQIASSPEKRAALKRMVSLCYQLRDVIQNGNLDAFGEILHEGWVLKRSLSNNISNSAIDEWYEVARRHGATGGKILGAGAGGFLAIYAPPERHPAICHALPALRSVPMKFERQGSQIIFYQPNV
jgi:D-glycero-alpha-D-manno-heptose-7-phosphate kinase